VQCARHERSETVASAGTGCPGAGRPGSGKALIHWARRWTGISRFPFAVPPYAVTSWRCWRCRSRAFSERSSGAEATANWIALLLFLVISIFITEAGFDLHQTKPVQPSRLEEILADPARVSALR
jgi:hypothetical protein